MATSARHFDQPRESLNRLQQRYLRPLNTPERWARRVMFGMTWCAVHSLLRLRVEGVQNLPEAGPFILAPSHTSSLDPFVLATAIPYRTMKQCRWAAAGRAITKNSFRRVSNRLAGSVPIWRNRSALSVGAAVLESGHHLIWFPEGHRTRSGELQEFRPGIGLLAVHTQVPVVPIRILGAYEAMPPGKKVPNWQSPVRVRIGKPMQLQGIAEEEFDSAAERFTEELHESMVKLGE